MLIWNKWNGKCALCIVYCYFWIVGIVCIVNYALCIVNSLLWSVQCLHCTLIIVQVALYILRIVHCAFFILCVWMKQIQPLDFLQISKWSWILTIMSEIFIACLCWGLFFFVKNLKSYKQTKEKNKNCEKLPRIK